MQREFHDVANIFPMMQGEEFDALKADIAAHGLREAIWLHPDGRIIDGRNRYLACCELGMEPECRTWDGAGSLVAFVVSLNLHRRHLTESQRAMIAAKLATMGEGRPEKTASIEAVSQGNAATLLNVSRSAVQRARVVYTNGDPDLVNAVERGDVAVSAAAEVASLPVEWQRVIVTNGDVSEAAKDVRNGRTPDAVSAPSSLNIQIVPAAPKPHVAHNSGNNEWYTPVEYLDAARAVMGGIDLDPASSDTANTIVNAERYFTAEQDGLLQHWTGCVWLNPPYSSDLIGKFADKLIHHLESGDVPEAIVLVNNATETTWFRKLIDMAAAVVFPTGRIRYWRPDGESGSPLQGQAFIYAGDSPDVFLREFAAFGWGAKL